MCIAITYIHLMYSTGNAFETTKPIIQYFMMFRLQRQFKSEVVILIVLYFRPLLCHGYLNLSI